MNSIKRNTIFKFKELILIVTNQFDKRVRTGESHKRASQNRARQSFELIKLKLCYLFIK